METWSSFLAGLWQVWDEEGGRKKKREPTSSPAHPSFPRLGARVVVPLSSGQTSGRWLCHHRGRGHSWARPRVAWEQEPGSSGGRMGLRGALGLPWGPFGVGEDSSLLLSRGVSLGAHSRAPANAPQRMDVRVRSLRDQAALSLPCRRNGGAGVGANELLSGFCLSRAASGRMRRRGPAAC